MGRKRCCGLGTSRVYTLPAPNGNRGEQLGARGGWIRAAAETRFLLGKEPSPSFGPSSAAPARPMFNIIFIFCQDQTFAGCVRIEGRTPGRPPSPALPSSAPLQLGSLPPLTPFRFHSSTWPPSALAVFPPPLPRLSRRTRNALSHRSPHRPQCYLRRPLHRLRGLRPVSLQLISHNLLPRPPVSNPRPGIQLTTRSLPPTTARLVS